MITDVFEYNQHFVAMMNIINNARINPPNRGHKHHIIPKCWFKAHNLEIDNSQTNLVKLTYEQHLKVHLLASYCIKTDEMKLKMKQAHNFLLLKGDSRYLKIGSLSEETRRKLSEAHKGKSHPISEETKRKIIEANKGRKPWNYGGNLSEETKRKLSESHKGHKHTKEVRNKMSQTRKGHIVTEETRRKISEAKKGKKNPMSEETKRKLSEALKGKGHPISEETKRKMSEAKKGKHPWNYGLKLQK